MCWKKSLFTVTVPHCPIQYTSKRPDEFLAAAADDGDTNLSTPPKVMSTLQYHKESIIKLIEASLSEPHTSELAAGLCISYIYLVQ